jgi:hypothetical protein
MPTDTEMVSAIMRIADEENQVIVHKAVILVLLEAVFLINLAILLF